SGDAITVNNHSGATEIIMVSSATAFTLAGGGTATQADVLIGDQISATGVNGVGLVTLDASGVVIGSFL
ncbi:MAG TPA: hypothetical protein VGS61_06370, partial [Acidimicrobiales bacterium]|nr:hypothetical protein [Acidimicrobiales bacterium]